MATIPFLQQATGGGLNRGQGIGLALMGLGQGLQAVSRGQQPNMMPLVAMASQMREENRQQQQAEAWQTYLADVAKTNPAMADQIKAIGALGPQQGAPMLAAALRKPAPTQAQQNAAFIHPNDPQAQRAYVARQGQGSAPREVQLAERLYPGNEAAQNQYILAQTAPTPAKAPLPPSDVRTAQYLYPGDPKAQRTFIEARTARPMNQFEQEVAAIQESNPGVGRAQAVNIATGNVPDALPGELAGRVGLIDTALENFEAARKELKNLSWGDRANLLLNRGDAGRAARALETGVEAALRAQTGAAAPEPEYQRNLNRFMPSPTDTPATAQQKMDLLEQFLTQTKENLLRGRGGPTEFATPVLPEAPAPAEAQTVGAQGNAGSLFDQRLMQDEAEAAEGGALLDDDESLLRKYGQ